MESVSGIWVEVRSGMQRSRSWRKTGVGRRMMLSGAKQHNLDWRNVGLRQLLV
jgi:hypothetical protein